MAANVKLRKPLDGERSTNNYVVLGGTEKDYTNSRELYNFESKQHLIPFDVKQSRITSKFQSTHVYVGSTSTTREPYYDSDDVIGLRRHIRVPNRTPLDTGQVMDKKVRFGSLSNSDHSYDNLVDNEIEAHQLPEIDIKQSSRELLSVRNQKIETLANQVKEEILRKYPKDYMSVIARSRYTTNVKTRQIKPSRLLANQTMDKHLDLLSPRLRSELAKRILLKKSSIVIKKSLLDLDTSDKKRQAYKPEISQVKVDYSQIQSKLKHYLGKSSHTSTTSAANQPNTAQATDKQIRREFKPPLYISQPFQHNIEDSESSLSFDHMTSVSAPADGAKSRHDLDKRPVQKVTTKEGTLPAVQKVTTKEGTLPAVVNVSLLNESLDSKEICQVFLPELLPNLGYKTNMVVNPESSDKKEIPIQDGVGQGNEKQYDIVREYDMGNVHPTSDVTFDKNKEIDNIDNKNSDSIDDNADERGIGYVTAHVGVYRPLPRVNTLQVFSERQRKTKVNTTTFTDELTLIHPCFKYDVNWVSDLKGEKTQSNLTELPEIQSEKGSALRNVTVGSVNISNSALGVSRNVTVGSVNISNSALGVSVNNYKSMVPKTNRTISNKLKI